MKNREDETHLPSASFKTAAIKYSGLKNCGMKRPESVIVSGHFFCREKRFRSITYDTQKCTVCCGTKTAYLRALESS